MNLCEDLLRGIYAYGFEKPSAIQQRAIVPCIAVSLRISAWFLSFYGPKCSHTILQNVHCSTPLHQNS